MFLLFRKNMTKKEYLIKKLEKELRRSSKGKMPRNVRSSLAKRTIERLDFSNTYQMHKSIQGYADLLVNNWRQNIQKTCQ